MNVGARAHTHTPTQTHTHHTHIHTEAVLPKFTNVTYNLIKALENT